MKAEEHHETAKLRGLLFALVAGLLQAAASFRLA